VRLVIVLNFPVVYFGLFLNVLSDKLRGFYPAFFQKITLFGNISNNWCKFLPPLNTIVHRYISFSLSGHFLSMLIPVVFIGLIIRVIIG